MSELERVVPQKPKYKLGCTEKEILWTLMSLGETEGKTLKHFINKQIKGSIYRLKKKELITKNGKKIGITEKGKSAVMFIASKGKIWSNRKVKLNTGIKLVAFDLDDTLIPGYVNENVDVELMRTFLRILKDNGIRTAVLSINPKSVVYLRLRHYGLLKYIDYPFHTIKGKGLLFLKESLNLKDSEIIFIGHDLTSDYLDVKRTNPKANVVLLEDSISNHDTPHKIQQGENIPTVKRKISDLIKLINSYGGNG